MENIILGIELQKDIKKIEEMVRDLYDRTLVSAMTLKTLTTKEDIETILTNIANSEIIASKIMHTAEELTNILKQWKCGGK